jgi:hypothetical protein
MKTAKGGKGKTAKKALKKAPAKRAASSRKVAKRAVKKIAPKKASIAATKSISFTPKDLEKLKKTMQKMNIPKEIREVLDAASEGNFDAFNNKVQALRPQRLNELVGALDWGSEAGLEALGKLGKDAQEFKDGVLGNQLPDLPTLVKCCCDRRIFPQMCKLCGCLFCRCGCCGCGCSWDDFCHHLHCHCCRGIPVYSGTETTSKLARSLRFTDDFTVTFPTLGQATIDFNSGLYYTKPDVDGLLTGKSDTGHNHAGTYVTPGDLTTALSGKSDTGHTHSGTYETVANVDTVRNRVTTLEGRKNTIAIKADFTIATTDTYPYQYDLSALTSAYGDIQVSVSGVHGAVSSTVLADWLRFTWSVDNTKKLSLRIWDQTGAECDKDDAINWTGTELHLKITAVG